MDETSLGSAHPRQVQWLQQFLAWMLPLDAAFAVLVACAGLAFGSAALLGQATIIGVYWLVLWAARSCAARGRIQAAVLLVCSGLLCAGLLFALIEAALVPSLAFVPLLAVAVALPYSSAATLRRLSVWCWLMTGAIVLLGELAPIQSRAPFAYTTGFRVSSLLTVVGLTLLLLSQFRHRLTTTLEQTRAAEERYSLAAEGANDGLWDWDLRAGSMYFSPRWASMLGYSTADLGTEPEAWFERVHPDDLERLRAELAVHQHGHTAHFESEYRIRDAHGRYRWMLCRGLAVRVAAGAAVRMAGSQTDITARKASEEQLRHAAMHDTLTGLPNRGLFLERLNIALLRTRRHPEYGFAVLFLDLDRFKVINDSLGHAAGDALLIDVAARLASCLRGEDVLARLGGDEFTILLDGIGTVAGTTAVAERIQAVLQPAFPIEDVPLVVTASIGIALGSASYVLPADVLRDADSALYRAKGGGRDGWALFDAAMHAAAIDRLHLEGDLRAALANDELVVYYQPIVELATGLIHGFEALVRWQHPTRGLLAPGVFLPVAEDAGMLALIGWRVMELACRQLQLWQTRFGAHLPLTMSVNVASAQFAQPDFTARIAAILLATRVSPAQLHLEITESVMMEQPQFATAARDTADKLGVRFHIDDFGTGYSSLGALHRLPIHALKIDRSFVQLLEAGGESRPVVQAITSLAHTLKLAVVAEGLETAEQVAYLAALGTTYGQGYFLAPPLPSAAAEALLEPPTCGRLLALPLSDTSVVAVDGSGWLV